MPAPSLLSRCQKEAGRPFLGQLLRQAAGTAQALPPSEFVTRRACVRVSPPRFMTETDGHLNQSPAYGRISPDHTRASRKRVTEAGANRQISGPVAGMFSFSFL